jgi:hypothetical protein
LNERGIVIELTFDATELMERPTSAELDHILIYTSDGAPEAVRLAGLGLAEGAANTHPGQGTANRRFFFHNAYLELLWVCAEGEARSEEVRPTRLWDRWSGRGGDACPFGFCFRPGTPNAVDPPFPAWEYRPSYLPKPLCIHIGSNVDLLTEPMLCYLAFAQRPDRHPQVKREPLEHAAGLCELTRMECVSPHAENASPTLRMAVKAGSIRLRAGTDYLVELGFDGERQGKRADCRPELPVVISW